MGNLRNNARDYSILRRPRLTSLNSIICIARVVFFSILLFICISTPVSKAKAQAFDFSKEKIVLYGGVSSVPISSNDFEDFHISDFERFGLGSREGRVLAPLSENDPSRSTGILLGSKYEYSNEMDYLIELGFTFGKINFYQILIGLNYTILDKNK